MNGDINQARNLLVKSLASNVDFYQQAAERDLLMRRVRLVEFPISHYLKFEFMSYQISAQYGTRILVKDITEEPSHSKLKTSYDFVMFDGSIVLRHDYDPTGLLRGGWLIDLPEQVGRYRDIAQESRSGAVLLPTFLTAHDL
jgi:hypothetical protein